MSSSQSDEYAAETRLGAEIRSIRIVRVLPLLSRSLNQERQKKSKNGFSKLYHTINNIYKKTKETKNGFSNLKSESTIRQH